MKLLPILALFFFVLPDFSYAACVPDAPAGVKRTFRSAAQVYKFKKLTPGSGVVDHTCSLGCGGIDNPINMQWQTVPDSLAKDKIENTAKGRKLYCNDTNSNPYRTVWNLNAAGKAAVYGVK